MAENKCATGLESKPGMKILILSCGTWNSMRPPSLLGWNNPNLTGAPCPSIYNDRLGAHLVATKEEFGCRKTTSEPDGKICSYLWWNHFLQNAWNPSNFYVEPKKTKRHYKFKHQCIISVGCASSPLCWHTQDTHPPYFWPDYNISPT